MSGPVCDCCDCGAGYLYYNWCAYVLGYPEHDKDDDE